MSCLDVMYPAYGHYAPYAKATSAFINHFQAPVCLSSPTPRCRDVLMESTGTPRGPEGVSASTKTGPSSSSSYPSTTRPEESPKEKQEVPEAEYLTSRCVLFTYYQGDISSVVDEHFSRALSSYMEAEGKRRASDLGNDVPSPSSRRSFPPSFWDCNYPPPQSRSHCDPGAPTYSMDPYASGLHPGLPQPHPHAHPHPHPSEGWGYAQTQAYGPPRPLHELYSPGGLEPHYGPLLMPAVRPPHMGALPGHHPYDVGKLESGAPWPGLLPHGEMALNMDAGLQHHKKGKELYWF
ncbi:transcription cofactor vestigial-like protein 2b [Esox lucius]|uniref:transcription cofactor vestigial-like protein 2b n=1 Tax=Esox lucius TaxID=8010 RepID=UPI0014772F35|nr:transcription cofactor vestigial-like protein 2b [Esox lucius]